MHHPAASAVLAALWLAAACGDDSAVPIDEIPPETRLVDLSGPERQGVCEWSTAVAREQLPAMFQCNGVTLSLMNCRFPSSDADGCVGTVAQWQVCLPNFVDRLAEDPCQILDLVFPGELGEFVDETPSCAGLGACTYTTGPGP